MRELLPLSLLGAIVGLDVVCFPQVMYSRPLVAATLAGAFVGMRHGDCSSASCSS